MNQNWFWAIPITAILSGVVTTWIRARYGYPLDRRGARRGEWPQQTNDLAELKATVAARDTTIQKLEERVRVLERIATDKSAALRDEIDRLRT